jgi:hypothetical protein
VHKLKEQFFDIYNFVHKRDAETAMDDWRDDVIKAGMEEAFSDLLGVLYEKEKKPKKPPKRPRKKKAEKKDELPKHWKNEVLAYFDQRDKTNAFCESMNNLSKTLNRAGRGYEFGVLRARVLYAMKPLEPAPLRELTEDPEEQHRYQTQREITRMYDALVARYGNICSRCNGVFEKNLELFLGNMVSLADWRLAEKRFHLRCGNCGRKFNIIAMSPVSIKPDMGPDIPNTQVLRAALLERRALIAKATPRKLRRVDRIPSTYKREGKRRRRHSPRNNAQPEIHNEPRSGQAPD